MPIPNDGWGAVENVIWQQKQGLDALGAEATILNRRGFRAALEARPWRYDLVHLHYDELAKFWIRASRMLGFPLIITTHYGYGAIPKLWDEYYESIFNVLLGAKGILVLSPAIADVFDNADFRGWIRILPNGTDVRNIDFSSKGNGSAICLGKIEPRKQQRLLATLLEGTGVCCDFVGPLPFNDFKITGREARYLGTWTRNEVAQRLTEYSCLVLISKGEAHPLVVLEAMAAGLSLVLSPEASANLDTSLPWIHIVEDFSARTLETIREACRENGRYREAIRSYVSDHFDLEVVLNRYIALIHNYLRQDC